MSRKWAALADGDAPANHNQTDHPPADHSQAIGILSVQSFSEWRANLMRNDWLARAHLPMLPFPIFPTCTMILRF